jgi:hypothetical protein
MASSGMLCRVALARTDVSEELSSSFIRVTRIDELGTTLAVTSNRRTLVLARTARHNIPEGAILHEICLVTCYKTFTNNKVKGKVKLFLCLTD